MGNRVIHEIDDESRPILSPASSGVQADDDDYGSSNAPVFSSATAFYGPNEYSRRPPLHKIALKSDQTKDQRVIRVPFSPNTNGYSRVPNTEDEDEEVSRIHSLASRLQFYRRLDPRPDSSLAMPDHVVPEDFMVRILVPVRGKQSSLITIFALWNTMMGTSLLSMPWAILQAGFVAGISLLVLVALLMFYTSYLVLKSVHSEPNTKFTEFSDVCKHFLGKYPRLLALFSSLVTLLGGAIVYWILLSNFLFRIVLFIHNKINPDFVNNTSSTSVQNSSLYPDVVCSSIDSDSVKGNGTDTIFQRFWTENLTVPLLLAAFLILLVNFKSTTFFTKVNSLGILSVIFLITFVIYKAVRWGVHLDIGLAANSSDKQYIPDFKWTFPALTGIGALAYFVQNCVITITRNQKNPQHNIRDLGVAYFLVAFSYIFIGVLVFVTFPLDKDCIKDNFLNNMASDDTFAFVAHIMLFFQMTCVLPLLLFILRAQLMMAVFGSEYPSFKHVLGLNLVMFAVCVVFAMFLPHIGSIIGFVGSFCGLAYAIALPCLVTMVAQYRNNSLTWASLIFHSCLIILGAANFVSQFLLLGQT